MSEIRNREPKSDEKTGSTASQNPGSGNAGRRYRIQDARAQWIWRPQDTRAARAQTDPNQEATNLRKYGKIFAIGYNNTKPMFLGCSREWVQVPVLPAQRWLW